MDIPIPQVSLPPEQPSSPPSAPPPSTTPAPAEPSHPQEVYSLWEARDESQIVDTLKGRFLSEYIYEYCRRHKWVDGKRPPDCHCNDVIVGLSWVGVQEASRAYGGLQIPIDKVKRRETEDMVEVLVECIDTKTGSSRIGIACQAKKIRLRTGQIIDDEFCYAKALSKAQRNSLRPLLPVTLLKSWIESYRTKVNGQQALPPATSPNAIAAEVVKPNGNGSQASPSASPQPTNGGSNGNGNGKAAARGYPSVGQVRRIFGIAFGHKVAKEDVLALMQRICGVLNPDQIPSRELYEKLCGELEKYNNGVPF